MYRCICIVKHVYFMELCSTCLKPQGKELLISWQLLGSAMVPIIDHMAS